MGQTVYSRLPEECGYVKARGYIEIKNMRNNNNKKLSPPHLSSGLCQRPTKASNLFGSVQPSSKDGETNFIPFFVLSVTLALMLQLHEMLFFHLVDEYNAFH